MKTDCDAASLSLLQHLCRATIDNSHSPPNVLENKCPLQRCVKEESKESWRFISVPVGF